MASTSFALSRAPRPVARAGRQPMGWSRCMPVPVVLALRLGSGQPLRRMPDRSRSPVRPSTTGDGSAGIAPPCTTTSRLTPRRASVCFSHWGYGIAYPSRSIRRPSHRSALVAPAASDQRTARDPARSPWITPSTISPRTAGFTCRGPCALVVPLMRAGVRAHRRDRVIGFPVRRRVTTSTGLESGSLFVRSCGFVSAPSAPRVTPTHWASTTELQRPKLGKDFHLLAGGAARRTTRTWADTNVGPGRHVT
jgi:hypothetical protein